MTSALIMNLAVIAVIVTGWTAAVAVFYTRLDETRAVARTVRNRELAQTPAITPRPEPVLAVDLAA